MRDLRKDDMDGHRPARSGGEPQNGRSEDLTCSEGQIEDLFSEGESTEVESEEEPPSGKRPGPQAAPKKSHAPPHPGRRQA